MKIKISATKKTQFEYHETENGELVEQEAYTMYGGIQVVSDDIVYTILKAQNGGLVIRAHASKGTLEHVSIAPRSGSEIVIKGELWKP